MITARATDKQTARLKNAGDRRRLQKNYRGILKFTENYVLKSCVDCGTLQLVLGVFMTGLYLDIM